MSSETQWILANGHNALLLYHALSHPHSLTEEIKGQVLCHAATEDRRRFVEIIIQHTENRRETFHLALQVAAGEGRALIVGMLIDAGADVNAGPVYYDGRTALQAAAGGGHLEVVETLLTSGADVNSPPAYCSRTALQAAAGGGHLEVVERLLTAGADVNAGPADHGGRTALQAAAGGGH